MGWCMVMVVVGGLLAVMGAAQQTTAVHAQLPGLLQFLLPCSCARVNVPHVVPDDLAAWLRGDFDPCRPRLLSVRGTCCVSWMQRGSSGVQQRGVQQQQQRQDTAQQSGRCALEHNYVVRVA